MVNAFQKSKFWNKHVLLKNIKKILLSFAAPVMDTFKTYWRNAQQGVYCRVVCNHIDNLNTMSKLTFSPTV